MGEMNNIHAATQPSQPKTSTSTDSAAAHDCACGASSGDAMMVTAAVYFGELCGVNPRTRLSAAGDRKAAGECEVLRSHQVCGLF